MSLQTKAIEDYVDHITDILTSRIDKIDEALGDLETLVKGIGNAIELLQSQVFTITRNYKNLEERFSFHIHELGTNRFQTGPQHVGY